MEAIQNGTPIAEPILLCDKSAGRQRLTPPLVCGMDDAPLSRRRETTELFNGQTLDGWRTRANKHKWPSHWTVGLAALNPGDSRQVMVSEGKGELINAHGHGQDIFSTFEFGDAVIELEVMVPRGSNSGIYVHGEYEIQVFDSHGKVEPSNSDMGAIYGASPPRNPTYRKPGEWSTYRIEFRAPRFDDAGNKSANAKFVKVELNGKVIHQDVEMKGPTLSGLTGREKPKGPLMLQGDHGAVAYRHIRITLIE